MLRYMEAHFLAASARTIKIYEHRSDTWQRDEKRAFPIVWGQWIYGTRKMLIIYVINDVYGLRVSVLFHMRKRHQLWRKQGNIATLRRSTRILKIDASANYFNGVISHTSRGDFHRSVCILYRSATICPLEDVYRVHIYTFPSGVFCKLSRM